MRNIIVGTKSKIKLSAVERVLLELKTKKLLSEYTLSGHASESHVHETPHNRETYIGASNRAKSLINFIKTPEDLYVGIESGLVSRYGMKFEECWCVVVDGKGKKSVGYSSGYELPHKIHTRMKKGESHINIVNELATRDMRSHHDTWANYSHGHLSREHGVYEAVRNALLGYLVD